MLRRRKLDMAPEDYPTRVSASSIVVHRNEHSVAWRGARSTQKGRNVDEESIEEGDSVIMGPVSGDVGGAV